MNVVVKEKSRENKERESRENNNLQHGVKIKNVVIREK